jgi:hypothetical protein
MDSNSERDFRANPTMGRFFVKKSALLAKLQANRATHRAQFLAAQEGFKQAMIDELERRLEDARKGKRFDASFRMTEPVDMTREYDRALTSLEMMIGDDIELDIQEFTCYVMDQWAWSAQVTASNSLYTQGVVRR